MKVLIYGAGAVGLALGSCLIRSDVEVTFVGRRPTLQALRKNGLLRSGIFGNHSSEPNGFQCLEAIKDAPMGEPFDFILVCVKSFDSSTAAAEIALRRDLVADRGAIVLFQNGWGNREEFVSRLSDVTVFNARVITGFRRPEPHHVEITVHASAVSIGSLEMIPLAELEAKLGSLAREIHAGGLPCAVSADVGKDIWAKILYNCALNPLGAIFGVPYGDLANNPHTRNVMDEIFDEIFVVMAAAGHETHWPDAPEYRRAFYDELVPVTASHESSMLQDLRLGRPLEIDSLTGAIIRLGEESNIATPVNRVIYELVQYPGSK